MTKEVEVGDEFTGKVVKTTTFGAFVELSKGTDGLLHISNIAPGQRADTVEEVLNKGDEIEVRVVEVDRERGRIGLRLADDPDVAGKSVEELAAIGTGGNGGGGGPRGRAARDRGRDRGGDRGGARRSRPRGAPRGRATATRALPDALSTASPTLDSGVRVVTEAMPSVRSVGARVLDRHRLAYEDEPEAGLSHLLEHMLFRGTDRYGSLEIDQIFDAMGAELNAGTGKETTSVYARVLDEHLAERVRRDGRHGLAPGIAARNRHRARGRPRGDRDVRGRPAGQGLRRARRGGLRRPPARPGDHRPRARSSPARRPTSSRAFHAQRYVPAATSCIAAAGLGRPRRARGARARGRRRGAAGVDRAARARRRPTASRRAVRFARKDTEQYHVCLGAPGIARDDDRRFALRVLDNVLGGTSSSRLFQEVREQRGLAYCVYSFTRAVRGHRPGRPLRRHAAGQRRRRRCRSSAPSSTRFAPTASTAEELERAKENVKGRIVLALESTSARMNRLGSLGARRHAGAVRRRDRSSASTR